MYFEDIYNKIRPLWKNEFKLDGLDESETYVIDISENWDLIGYKLHKSKKGEYSEWESMLSFTIYQTLTKFALGKWKNNKDSLMNFDEVPIAVFEEYYRKNLEAEGNEFYLTQYKGFKDHTLG